MSRVRPRAVVQRGSALAVGFVFDLSALDEAQARQRVLALYEPGAVLLAHGRLWLLRLPRARRVRAEQAPGALLTGGDGGLLLAAPLTPAELRALDPAPGSAVLVRDGVASALPPHEWTQLDPAGWLDLTGFTRLVAQPLAAEVLDVQTAVPAAESDLRRVLHVPDAAPERAQLLAALDASAEGRAAPASRGAALARSSAGPSAISDWLHAVADWLRALPGALRRGLATQAGAGQGAAPSVASSSSPAALRPPAASRLRRALAWLDARARHWLYWSRLGRTLGRWHARYLRETLELFERGDFDSALRHAIPLGGGRGEQLERLALSPPRPRADLTIRPRGAGGVASAVPAGPGFYALLRQHYEQAARVLIERGRFREAAFVYAELLGDAAAAVALLERHGQLRAAAELAEGRALAPDLIVRQWLLAGELERALLIARRDGAFAAALARLGQGHHALAARLRLAWGDALAEAGDYAAACDALWPLPEARALAAGLLERARLAGGAQGGRALARMLELQHAPARSLALLDELLADPSADAAVARNGLASGLRDARANPSVRRAARATVRALLHDRVRAGVHTQPGQVEQLIELAEDAVLRADLPALQELPRARVAHGPIVQHIAAADAGSIAVEDAALLPNGRLLVALGAAGMRLYAPDLRSHSALREPAERLVLNPLGTRALALASRGRLQRIARVELTQRRCESWCDLELDAFAGAFDGSRWFVLRGRDLLALDATGDDVRALLRVPQIAGPDVVEADLVAHGKELELLLVDETDGMEHFGYALDPLVLRKRQPLSGAEHGLVLRSVLRPGRHGLVVQLVLTRSTYDDSFMHVLHAGPCAVGLGLPTADGWRDAWPGELHATSSRAAAAFPCEQGVQVALVDLENGLVVRAFVLEGASRARLRLDPAQLLIADDRGRVRVVSASEGHILRDVRVSV